MKKYYSLEHAFNTEADFPLHLETMIRDVLYKGYNDTPAIYPSIVSEILSSTNKERYMGIIGSLDLAPHEPLEEYADSSLSESGLDIYNHKYGKTISFPWELIEDDIRNVFTDIPSKFGKGYKTTLDRAVIDVLTNTSHYSAARGNLVTSTPEFSYDGIVEAYDLFSTMRGQDGELINLYPDTLVCHPTQMWKAYEIFAKERTILTQPTRGAAAEMTGSSVIENPLIGRFKILTSPYLPNKLSWYLFKAKDGMVHQKRKALKVWTTTPTSATMMHNDAYVIKARTRFGIGMKDYRYHTYSPGR